MRLQAGALLGASVLVLVLVGCGGGSPASEATPGLTSTTTISEPPAALRADDLDAHAFVAGADDVDGYRLADGTNLQLAFQPGLLTVDAGCQVLIAPYDLVAGRIEWATDPLREPGACPPERLFQDRWIADRLLEGVEASLEGKVLTLRGDGVELRLRDDPARSPDDAPLVGTTWLLTTLLDGDDASTGGGGSAPPRLRIQPSGAAEVFDGCNEGSAVVQLESDGAILRFGEIQATRAGCEGSVAEVADAIAAALDGAVLAEVQGDTLTITKGDRTLVLRAE